MNLYMIHVGFYDKTIADGIYESHLNFFLAAEDPKDAKEKTLLIPQYLEKNMHIDGIKEISSVDGYKVILEKNNSKDLGRIFSYDDSKQL